jgi:ParB/RepB/Spo0J family partition protein
MIRQIETKPIPVNLIDVGHRYRQPSEADVDQLAKSIKQDGLLAPISVRADGGRFRLVTGAIRLAAVRKLGALEIVAVVVEGTEEDFEIAELVENLERLHLNRDQREEWTKKLVELRAKAEHSDPGKHLNDKLSFKCFRGSSCSSRTTNGRSNGLAT